MEDSQAEERGGKKSYAKGKGGWLFQGDFPLGSGRGLAGGLFHLC